MTRLAHDRRLAWLEYPPDNKLTYEERLWRRSPGAVAAKTIVEFARRLAGTPTPAQQVEAYYRALSQAREKLARAKADAAAKRQHSSAPTPAPERSHPAVQAAVAPSPPKPSTPPPEPRPRVRFSPASGGMAIDTATGMLADSATALAALPQRKLSPTSGNI